MKAISLFENQAKLLRLSSASLASEVLKRDLPHITSAEFNDFVLQKLAESKFFEIAFLIKGYALTLLKQLRLITAQLSALVGLDLRERAPPRRAGERPVRDEPALPLDVRLQQDLSRGDSNPRPSTPARERFLGPDALPPSDDQPRWESSLRKMLDEAEEPGQRPLLSQPEQDLTVPLEDLLALDADQLQKLDELYRPSTPSKTKRKLARAEALRRVERAVADVQKLAAVKAAFEDALQRTPAAEPPAPELLALNVETEAIFEALKGLAADRELVENIDRLNGEAEAIEARRAQTDPDSLSRHGLPSMSRSEGVSERRPEPELAFEPQNLDVIFETMNENATRTHFFASTTAWPRLEDFLAGEDKAAEVQRSIREALPARKITFEQLMEKGVGHHPADVFCQLLEMQARGGVALSQPRLLGCGPISVKARPQP